MGVLSKKAELVICMVPSGVVGSDWVVVAVSVPQALDARQAAKNVTPRRVMDPSFVAITRLSRRAAGEPLRSIAL